MCRLSFLIYKKPSAASVPHGPLIDELISLNILMVLISWISSYLYNRKQQVGVSGVNSDPVNVTYGVPQGSVLGPLLFLIYVDGLTSIPLSRGSLVIFADDLLLHKVICCIEDFLALQEDVDLLANWINDHNLTLNVRKCKSLLVSQKILTSVVKWYISLDRPQRRFSLTNIWE